MLQKPIMLGPNLRRNETFKKIFCKERKQMITYIVRTKKLQISTVPPDCPCNIVLYLYLLIVFFTLE